MLRERYIRVPKNTKAMHDYDYGIQKKEQMEEMVLNENQYMILDELGVFDKINKECNIIIDDYEEEILEFDKIPIAIGIVNQFIKSNENDELIMLAKILNLAIMYGTVVGFDF